MNLTNQLFNHLDQWRHVPAYQLERRTDIFFSLYIPEILTVKFGVEIEGLIPEFPVRVGTIDPNVGTNRSFKIDFLAKVKGEPKVFFIELKTDNSSRRSEQDRYLAMSKETGMVRLLEGLKQIYRATNAKKKYRCLFRQLDHLGVINFTPPKEVEIVDAEYHIEIIYIQPTPKEPDQNVISFSEIAEIVGKHTDDISIRFAQSLLSWAATKAGDIQI